MVSTGLCVSTALMRTDIQSVTTTISGRRVHCMFIQSNFKVTTPRPFYECTCATRLREARENKYVRIDFHETFAAIPADEKYVYTYISRLTSLNVVFILHN